MKEDVVLIGSGGCMREIIWQIQELNKKSQCWNILGYIDIISQWKNESADIIVGNKPYPYLGNDDYLLSLDAETNVAICIGASDLRKEIAQRLMANPHLKFPNLILGDTVICPDVELGQGCIISIDCRISTNVTMGDFTFLNMGTVICHDCSIGSYTTLSPDVKLAGNVYVGEKCSLGMGTKVIQGINIGNCVTTGAGSVVIRNVEPGRIVVGVPARPLE